MSQLGVTTEARFGWWNLSNGRWLKSATLVARPLLSHDLHPRAEVRRHHTERS
jgi:hypothetical protein